MANETNLRPDSYPDTTAVDHTDTYFETPVADPFRWLEDADDPRVLEWTQAQHDLARSILDRLPGRDEYQHRLTRVWDYPRMGQPLLRGGRLFSTRNTGLQAQPVLSVREPDGTERVLLDPNTLSDDGTVALMEWEPTRDGRLLGYALSESGEDWRTVRIRDVESGNDLAESLGRIKFSPISWLPSGSGFFYSRFPDGATDSGERNRDQSHQLFFHRVGTLQSEDRFIFEHPTLRGVILHPEVTADGRYLVVTVTGDSFIYNRLSIADLGKADALSPVTPPEAIEVRPLFDELDASYRCIGTLGDQLLVLTSKDAPRLRIALVHPSRPSELETLVPESEDVIEDAHVAGGEIIVSRLRNAYSAVERYDLSGEPRGEIALPGIGSTTGAAEGALPDQRRIFIPYSSFLSPPSILEYDLETGVSSVHFEPHIEGFDADRYETRQVFATSRDGTRVPVFVTTAKRVRMDSSNPTILYGYGGFDVSLKPSYPSWLPVWLEEGGVYAVAVLRGGGEFGDEWHLAGMFERKQNVFDDFAAAAAELCSTGYTSERRLAIEGGSNGGLLVAATMLQHPSRFGAVLCHVPVTDMLRYQHFTAGRYWTSEYGDAQKSEEHFRALLAYSPLHNVEDGRDYPPILIMSADHDDRVVPMHSKKFAARLQQADAGSNVVLLRIETRAGHGAGKPTTKQIELRADVFAFLAATIRR
ncbi:MAG: prolyl oligopeptidase family serine peptidase [Spirochaetota bacterium]